MNTGRSTPPEPPATRPWFAAHELFTCLNAVRGASELLLAGAAGPLSAEGLGAVATIAEAARELEGHIRHCQAIDRLRDAPRPTQRPARLSELLPENGGGPLPEVLVLVAAEEIRAAFSLLCPPAVQPRIEVAERRRTAVLSLPDAHPDRDAGRGRILVELAGLRLRRGGGRLLLGERARIRVLLPKAPPQPAVVDGKSGEEP